MRPQQPKLNALIATPKVQKEEWPQLGGHVSIRNTGVNTLWLSWDDEKWFDVASGTSYDEDSEVRVMFYKTMTGKTTFVVNWVPWQ